MVPDAPVTPIDPDPGTLADPAEPLIVPVPQEEPTPVDPETNPQPEPEPEPDAAA